MLHIYTLNVESNYFNLPLYFTDGGIFNGEGEGQSSKVFGAAKKDEKIDPYSYLHGDKFTTEIYKIEIRNLPRYTGHAVSYMCIYYHLIIIKN